MISFVRNSQWSKALSLTLVFSFISDIISPSLWAMNNSMYTSDVLEGRAEFTKRENVLSDFVLSMIEQSKRANNSELQPVVSENSNPLSELSVLSLPGLPNGGGQKETGGYTIGSTDGLVDKFTGDFSYSIPLMDVEGYPISISYNSNVSMLQEASWVGLGWDLNIGSVSREMRGIPDEFNGEQSVTRVHNELTSETNGIKSGTYVGISGSGSGVSAGAQATLLLGSYTDNYLGLGQTIDFGLGGQFSIHSAGDEGLYVGLNGNLGFSYDSKNGLGYSQGIGISAGYGKKQGLQVGGQGSYGRNFNSRSGMNNGSISFGASMGYSHKSDWKYENAKSETCDLMDASLLVGSSLGYSSSSTITYGSSTMIPRNQFNSSLGGSLNTQFDAYLKVKYPSSALKIGIINQSYSSDTPLDILLSNYTMEQPAYGYLHSGKRRFDDSGAAIMDFNRSSEGEFSEEMRMLPFSSQTHDIFYVSGAGVGATVRPMRSDFGTYYDPVYRGIMNDLSTLVVGADQVNVSVGVVYDVDTPNGIGVGIGAESGTMKGLVQSGDWDGHILEFTPQTADDYFDPSTYFKPVGERTPVETEALNAVGGWNPNAMALNAGSSDISTTNTLANSTNPPIIAGTLNASEQNTTFATYFKPYLPIDLVNSDPSFISYGLNGATSTTSINRSGGFRQNNHITRVDVTSAGGGKYTYGIPAYNFVTEEVSFSCGEGINSSNNVNPALTVLPINEMVVYTPNVDNNVTNEHGAGHYFDRTILPSYAHSFLLTEMTGPDYVDVSDDGLSMDDPGSWHKFNYTRAFGESDPFRWRFPISGAPISDPNFPQARFSEGVVGTSRDDIASYTYGEKEIWYAHSVESKNLIAIFYLGDRSDMYSVAGENGELVSGKPLKNLEKIVLYGKSDWLRQVNEVGYVATPVQIVEFIYDYSLCPNSPGNLATYSGGGAASGKLTLKELRFRSGFSDEGSLSRVAFDYGNENPAFNYASVDAWGGFKPNLTTEPNSLSPYTLQNATDANDNAQAWKLKAIDLPSGGRMEIEYEADRYGHVQNRRAMRHMQIEGMLDVFQLLKLQAQTSFNGVLDYPNDYFRDYGNLTAFLSSLWLTPTPGEVGVINNSVFDQPTGYASKFGNFNLKAIPQNVIMFKLETPLPASTYSALEADQFVREAYFHDPSFGPNKFLDKLYVKNHFVVQTGEEETSQVPMELDISKSYPNAFGGAFDITSGFSENLQGMGVMPANGSTGNYEYGYVIVDPIDTGNREEISNDGKDKVDKGALLVNPMQLMALQFSRQYLTELVYGSCDGCDPNLSIDWKVLFGQDMYEAMIMDGGYAPQVTEAAGKPGPMNTLKLFEPDNVKFGGNARVKTIRYMDDWASMTNGITEGGINGNEFEGVYEWQYVYGETDEIGDVEPSGVASFEGMAALDENSLYGWTTYVNLKKKFPDERKFTPAPISEMLYPTPVVGYDHVEVYFNGDIDYGHSESTFHTAGEQDYITTANSTVLDKSARIEKNNPITGESTEIWGLSQGHMIITNDFHGKPNESRIVDNNGNLISRSRVNYYGLGENVNVIDRNGTIESKMLAAEIDIHADMRHTSDETDFVLTGLTMEIFYVAPASVSFDFSPTFSTNFRERGFYAHTLVKHINYSAVVRSIETEYLGSINTAENILYDRYTGEPIVTSLRDEFEDQLYSIAYPAHWGYKEFRELIGTENSSETVSFQANGSFLGSSISKISAGDEISLPGYSGVYYVAQNYPVPDNGALFLIDEDGNQLNPGPVSLQMTIVKSNHKNRLLETMQGVVTKDNPIVGGQFVMPTSVYSASALSYRDRLNVACGHPCTGPNPEIDYGNNNQVPINGLYNPYLLGARGILVQDQSFAWQDERIGDLANHGIRYDGEYASYIPFYQYNVALSRWVPIDNANHADNDPLDDFQKWRSGGETTVFDRYGKGKEGKNLINVHSAVLYGYNYKYAMIPVAEAINARQSDIAFDGFEDYRYLDYSELKPCEYWEGHFDFMPAIDVPNGVYVTNAKRHSGLASLVVAPGQSASAERLVDNSGLCYATDTQESGPDDFVLSDECLCIKYFEPMPGDYIIGAWLNANDLVNARVIVETAVNPGVYQEIGNFPAAGAVLDGWQRLEGEFTIPGSPNTPSFIRIRIQNDSETEDMYIDDIRIHPFLAGMTTTVYDPKTLLPMASHDGYNFTTFFNYDENLNQVRMRVETVEGIKTIGENEAGGQKDF